MSLVVMYDQGAAGPRELGAGLSGLTDLVFVVKRSERTVDMVPYLEQYGRVILRTDYWPDDVQALNAFNPEGVVTFSDRCLLDGADVAAAYGLPFHTRETATALCDKYIQRERLRSANVDTVRFASVQNISDLHAALNTVGLPLVLKPRSGYGSRDTFRIEGVAQAEKIFRSLVSSDSPNLIAEEYLQGLCCEPFGDYVSVESVVVDGESRCLAVTGKFPLVFPFREVGQFWPSHLGEVEDRAVRSLVSRALAALEVADGVTHTEVKLTQSGPRIIEVNGRLGGHISHLYGGAWGFDFIRAAGNLAMGRAPEFTFLKRERPDSVFFQYHNPAPPFKCKLVKTDGAERVNGIAEVSEYRPYANSGTLLSGGIGTYPLDMTAGSASTHARMFAVIREALSKLEFTFDVEGIVIHVAAQDLGGMAPAGQLSD